MSRWPEINWQVFGAALDAVLCELTNASISIRSLDHVSARTLYRARRGRRIGAGNYVAICVMFDWRPELFLTNAPPPLPDRLRAIAQEVSRQTSSAAFCGSDQGSG